MSGEIGKIVWRDLTVPEAERILDFYGDVVGWQAADHPMGDCADFDIRTPGGETVAGICHARGANASLPPQWLIYVTVVSVEESAKRCRDLGGEVLDGPRPMGKTPFCVIRDPAGAVLALVESE